MEEVKAWKSKAGNLFATRVDAMADDIKVWLYQYTDGCNKECYARAYAQSIAESADAFAIFLNELRLTDGKEKKKKRNEQA